MDREPGHYGCGCWDFMQSQHVVSSQWWYLGDFIQNQEIQERNKPGFLHNRHQSIWDHGASLCFPERTAGIIGKLVVWGERVDIRKAITSVRLRKYRGIQADRGWSIHPQPAHCRCSPTSSRAGWLLWGFLVPLVNPFLYWGMSFR